MWAETNNTKKFTELLDELEDCYEDEQKQLILEMNSLIEEMDEKEFELVSTKELFNKMDKMIEEKKISLENQFLLLKHMGYRSAAENELIIYFNQSLLNKRYERMIVDENEKKEGKNESFLVDLGECYLLLNGIFSKELLSICIPCLLVVSSNRDEDEETQKKVEMALLALSCIPDFTEVRQGLCIDEIQEIIQYHQKHNNLTRLAYQYAWQFLIDGLHSYRRLKIVIVFVLHFAREASRELEELSKLVDWKRKDDKKEKETKEELALIRWLVSIEEYFDNCQLRNDEHIGLINSIVRVFRVAKDNCREISNWFIHLFEIAAKNREVKIVDLLKSGAVGAVLEEIQQSTVDDQISYDCLFFFLKISIRLKEKTNEEAEEAERKELKRKIFEKMEEEGYEDIVASFHGVISFRNNIYRQLSKNISDYFVNV